MSISRIGLMNVEPKSVAVGSMKIIDGLSSEISQVQIASIAAVFKLVSDRYDIPVSDLMVLVDNLMTVVDGRRAEFKAVEQYMNEQW